MNHSLNKSNYILLFSFLFIIFSLGLITFIKKDNLLSITERRNLTLLSKLNVKDITSGKYFNNLESYLLDQIPLRDTFKTLKSINLYYIFNKKDNHKVFIKNGYASKISYPISKDKEELLINKINYLTNTYFTNSKVYTSIVPDKSYYLVNNDYPVIDYNSLRNNLKKLPNYIDIFNDLSIESYYKTDIHWRNDMLIDLSNKYISIMNESSHIYSINTETFYPFYGVLYGQSSLPMKPDHIKLLYTKQIYNSTLYRMNKQNILEKGKIYDESKINTNDPYDIFLGGASNIIEIDNNLVNEGKTLYLFSDSFGRSLAPLLISNYDKVIVVDLRYIKMSTFNSKYKITNNSDILLLYSIDSLSTISNLQVD